MNKQTQKAVDLMKSKAEKTVLVETEETKLSEKDQQLVDAIAQMKQQLRFEKKETLVHQWIGLYAQVIQLTKEIENLKNQLNNVTVASAAEGESK